MTSQLIRTLFILGLFVGLAGPVHASDDLQEKIELCTTCHGEAGLPEQAEVPIIWGQEFYYLYVQLKDYKAGRRANEVMQGMVEDLSKEQMQALAQHFAEKKWPATGFRSTDAADAAGQTAAAAGQCVQCHLGGYEGNSRVPRLAGQTHTYPRPHHDGFQEQGAAQLTGQVVADGQLFPGRHRQHGEFSCRVVGQQIRHGQHELNADRLDVQLL